MFDLSFISEFSRTHCIAICAALVPANLLATLQTLIFVGLDRPTTHIKPIILAANLYALLMICHVVTWFEIGVVRVPTFVLLSLGCVCISINAWAIAHPTSLSHLLKQLWAKVSRLELRSMAATKS
jgi:hypothetical protein